MFSSERMKTFDRMTFSAGLMDPTALPNQTYQSAKVAWHDAQAAGERFRAAKFKLQAQVLQAWADYALQAERIRIQEQNLGLLRLVADTAASRVRAGASQQEQLRADVAARLAENGLATARSELSQQQAKLNAMLRRPADAPLEAPPELPQPRELAAADDTLLAAGVANNPELATLGREREARLAAVERARLEYLPQFNPMAAFTGSVSQSVGAAIALPTQLPRIRAMIDEARSDLRRIEASAGQTGADRAAEFAVALLALRDAERRERLFSRDVLPLADRTVDLAQRGYSSGNVTYLDLIDTQRTRLDVRLMVAEARTTRERMLAELERLAGVDAETLTTANAATRPTEASETGGPDDAK
jgi:outer membrane protein TolC